MDRLKSANAYTLLRERIVSGDLSPGAPLKGAELVAATGFKPTPVREALIRLEAEGLALLSSHRGFSVAPLTADGVGDVCDGCLRLQEPLLHEALLIDNTDYDAALTAAGERLHEALSPRAGSDKEAIGQWIAAEWAFHRALSRPGPGFTARLWSLSRDHLARACALLMSDLSEAEDRLIRPAVSFAAHEELMEAALKRKKKTARRLLEAHYEALRTALVALAEQRGARA